MSWKAALWACLVLVLILGGAALAQSTYEPVFEESDCPFDLPDVTCGFVIVPEDRANPDGAQVQLAVAIVPARSGNPEPDPVIYLEGGPGGAALLGIESLMNLPFTEDRDLIVFDQRGTGFSVPSLNCPELESDDGGDGIELCRDRLIEEGVNLDAYNSAASAADVADIQAALGYDQVNLVGVSYGTKLALTTLRDFPDGIRSAVIDSVYPPEVNDLALNPVALVDAYQNLFDRCAADASCSEAFPDLEANFYDTVSAYNDAPVYLETDDGELEITGDEIISQFFLALYDSTRIPYLPYALDLLSYTDDEQALRDGYDILTGAYIPDDTSEPLPSAVDDSEFVQNYIDEYGDIDDSEGQAYSVDCAEEYQLDNLDEAYASAEAAPEPLVGYFTSSIDDQVSSCQTWGVQTSDPVEAERVQSDVPTLILSGAMDPITPPSSGESAAAGLPNSIFLLFPTAGHGISFTDNDAGECAKSIVATFLSDPGGSLDTSCIEETDVIDFYIGE
ncbi:MAG: alpha/beta fold hydrolase [Anaerolineae bacterium]